MNKNDFKITDGVLEEYNGTDTEVIIPNGVIEIDVDVLYKKSITKVVFPSSVERIYGFGFCPSLTNVIVLNPKAKIGCRCFENSGIKDFNHPSLKIENGFVIEDGFLLCCTTATRLETVEIPDTVKIINEDAFCECLMKEIIIPDSVEEIRPFAFSRCHYLKKVTNLSHVKKICLQAFDECENVDKETINLAESLGMNDEPDMVFVEGGSMILGSDNEDEFPNNPKHKVTLDSFYISRFNVSQELWDSVMKNESKKQTQIAHDVSKVSWYDAVEFCNRLSRKEGLEECYNINKTQKDPNNENDDDNLKWIVSLRLSANGYRLPTEAEWEYSARYDDDENSNVRIPCGKLGLWSMRSNIAAWCWDWYNEKVRSGINPTGPSFGSYRVWRGDEFVDEDRALAYRHYASPFSHSILRSFHLVRSNLNKF